MLYGSMLVPLHRMFQWTCCEKSREHMRRSEKVGEAKRREEERRGEERRGGESRAEKSVVVSSVASPM